MPVIVVDAGGTYLRFGVADDAGELHMYSRRRIPNSQSYFGCPSVWESIVEWTTRYVREVECEVQTGDAIALALPGPIVDGRRLVAAPTITGRYQSLPDIAGALATETGRKIYLLNDVSAAAWYLSEHLDAQRFFVVTVSSGIGGKLFDRRHPEGVFDSPEYAGEIGHIVVERRTRCPAVRLRRSRSPRWNILRARDRTLGSTPRSYRKRVVWQLRDRAQVRRTGTYHK